MFPLSVESVLKEAEKSTDRTAPLKTSKEWMDLLQGAVDGLNRSEFVRPSYRFLVHRKLLIQLVNETTLTNDVIRRNPGAFAVSINSPIFIFGPGHSGSALLQGLLSIYPNVHYATFDKLHSVTLGLSGCDCQFGSRWPDPLKTAMTGVRHHEKLLCQEPCECSELVTKYLFLQLYGSDSCDCPIAFNRYLTNKEFVKYAYELYRQDLQLMFYLSHEFQPVTSSSAARFVFQSPAHSVFIDAIVSVFPDAAIIQLHRDPARVAELFLSLIRHRSHSDKVDSQQYANNLLDWFDHISKQMMQQSRKQQEQQLGTGTKLRVIDIKYNDLVRNPVGVCAQIADSLGWENNDKIEANLRERLGEMNVEHQDESGSRALHELSEYGLTAEGIRGRFKMYYDYYNA